METMEGQGLYGAFDKREGMLATIW